jgi:hypothetical protein
VEPTIAIPEPELHTPPNVASLNVVFAPTHTFVVPVIAAGFGYTLIKAEAWQPVGRVYNINVEPLATPVIIPLTDPTVATEGVTELHVPPAGVVLSNVDAPTHTLVLGMAAGVVFTVMIFEAAQPVGSVYFIVSVPAVTPVIVMVSPVEPLIAALLLAALHTPPAVVMVSEVELPTHTFAVPVIVAGNGFTVIIFVAVQPVGKV